jgi:hypothetical protein
MQIRNATCGTVACGTDRSVIVACDAGGRCFDVGLAILLALDANL